MHRQPPKPQASGFLKQIRPGRNHQHRNLRPFPHSLAPIPVIAPTALPNPARRLWCGRGPDPTIMRGYRQSEFLQRRYIVQIERAAVQLLKVIPADREPERHSLVRIAGVHPDERIGRPLVAAEHQYSASLVAIPVIEEEIRALPDVSALAPDTQQLPN